MLLLLLLWLIIYIRDWHRVLTSADLEVQQITEDEFTVQLHTFLIRQITISSVLLHRTFWDPQQQVKKFFFVLHKHVDRLSFHLNILENNKDRILVIFLIILTCITPWLFFFFLLSFRYFTSSYYYSISWTLIQVTY